MTRSNVSGLQQTIESFEMSELVLEHRPQSLNAARMQQASDGDLTAIDPDRATLTGVIDT